MSTNVWCELVCDRCYDSLDDGEWTVGDEVPRGLLFASGLRAGWTFENNEAYCKACSAGRAAPTSPTPTPAQEGGTS